jgi:hypothetical protein
MSDEFLTPAESRSYPSPTATPWEDLRTVMNYELFSFVILSERSESKNLIPQTV